MDNNKDDEIAEFPFSNSEIDGLYNELVEDDDDFIIAKFINGSSEGCGTVRITGQCQCKY